MRKKPAQVVKALKLLLTLRLKALEADTRVDIMHAEVGCISIVIELGVDLIARRIDSAFCRLAQQPQASFASILGLVPSARAIDSRSLHVLNTKLGHNTRTRLWTVDSSFLYLGWRVFRTRH